MPGTPTNPRMSVDMNADDLTGGPDPVVFTYDLKASNGRHIRMATGVRFADGHTIRFMERMPKRAAIAAGWRARANGIGDGP
jgi:hypothetical protein